jgi:hypothetical protein
VAVTPVSPGPYPEQSFGLRLQQPFVKDKIIPFFVFSLVFDIPVNIITGVVGKPLPFELLGGGFSQDQFKVPDIFANVRGETQGRIK